jgi:hypothetical protein
MGQTVALLRDLADANAHRLVLRGEVEAGQQEVDRAGEVAQLARHLAKRQSERAAVAEAQVSWVPTTELCKTGKTGKTGRTCATQQQQFYHRAVQISEIQF